MRASVTKAFPGVEDGQIYGRHIEVGEEITGDLAQAAVDAGWADLIAEDSKIVKTDEKQPKNGKNSEKTVILTGNQDQNGEKTPENGQKTGPDGATDGAPAVEIPADWDKLKWFALKALAEKIKGGEVADSAEAKSVIESEVARRG